MIDTIPYHQFDQFFFQEVIISLPVSLQELARDRRILHHEDQSRLISSTQELYQRQYSYIPHVLNDIFNLSDDRVFQVGCAWLLGVIDFVLTDSLVDGQVANYRQVTLLVAVLRQMAQTQFRQLKPKDMQFHRAIDEAFADTWHALAIEAESVDAHKTPYTLAQMTSMYYKKAALFRLVIRTMGELSRKTQWIEPLEKIYNLMSLADQLLDDAMDWEKDFRAGRWFLPVVMGLESAGKPYETAEQLTPEQMEKIIVRYRVQSRMVQIAQDCLSGCDRILTEQNWSQTNIGSVIAHRKTVAEQAQNRYAGQQALNRFLSGLDS